MFEIGAKLLETSKKNVHQKFGKERDLLSLLTRANMDPDLPESQRMSDEDVLSRLYFPSPPVFILPSHRNTYVPICWT